MAALAPGPVASVTCPWCGQYYATHPSRECDRCGGPLPAPHGAALAAPPPPPPRRLPDVYERAVLLWKNTLALIGTIFAAIGGLFGVLGIVMVFVFLPVGLPFVGTGVLFGGLGLALRASGRGRGLRQLDALRNGIAAQGRIVAISLVTSERINGRSPWRIDYSFSTASGPMDGSTKAFDPPNGVRQPEQQVWVVYLPNDPSVSSLWPPVS